MSRLALATLVFWSYALGVIVGTNVVGDWGGAILVVATVLVLIRRAPDVVLQMDARTAELVQTCIEAHIAVATRIQGNDHDRVNTVIVDLEKQLLKHERKG